MDDNNLWLYKDVCEAFKFGLYLRLFLTHWGLLLASVLLTKAEATSYYLMRLLLQFL